jgi:D-xylose transport system substrate-binding protein
MFNKRGAGLLGAMMLLAAACNSGTSSPAPASHPAGSGAPASAAALGQCVVGVSWNNFQQPRWAAKDRPSMQRTITNGGGIMIDFDANLSDTQQLTDVQTLINQGAKVIVLLAQSGTSGAQAVKLATDAGIPVIAYDRLIEDPKVLYMSFNNTDVGNAEATAMLAKVPPGTADKPANYVLIKGDPGDANASTFLPAGWDAAGLKAAVTAGTIKILNNPPDGTFTKAWDTTTATTQMEAIIDAANAAGTKIDGILAENDSTALGTVAALKNKSYGIVPISGQDGDTANLQNVAAGWQYVDVWKDANQLGNAAGAAALQLCKDPNVANVTIPSGIIDAASAPDNLAVQDFTTPGNNVEKSVILKVQPVTQENLQKIIDAKWLTLPILCANATDPATAAPICAGAAPSPAAAPSSAASPSGS